MLKQATPHPPGDHGPLTVLHVTQPVDGGVARVVTDLVRDQTAEGLRAVVLCPPEGPLPPAAAAAGADVLPWPATREPGAGLSRETAGIARAVRNVRPDLVHLHSAKAGLAGRLALRGRVPTVFQPHAWSFEAVSGPTAALALRWERHAARWAHRILCVSDDELWRGREEGVSARFRVIRNGVDLDRFRPVGSTVRRQARTGLATLYGLPQRAPLVVCVGRLCRQKGQDLLLRAWPEVTARVPGARLALVGDGPSQATLRAAAPAGVVFAGATGDPLPWYAAADVVVQPSRWEGMALAPLEAMACGRPVLVTDVSGARESLPPGRADTCLVPPGNLPALSGALAALLLDPGLRGALSRQARDHAQAFCDVRRTAAAVRGLYRELLGGEPGGTVTDTRTAGCEAKELTRR
ncbi:glycosyltransferase [Streptomyces sp. ACA25]|uniref:glycosyltransferase n=1 Tax=Streptomyces sp. ACA25 TaxID=3022596 RepID=UPI002306F519|nr:glycosyltransferase [Streptomyces sp. ACA25]MDB1086296.1 glycosyltransferase [Streptomyces sp. ACA25]